MVDAPGAMSAPTPVRARLDGVPRRLPKGTSDRIALTGGKCTCDRSEGTIVLFYAYVPIEDPCSLVARLRDVCGTHGVTGKLRIGREGINGTAAGSHAGIAAMRAELASESSREPSLAAAASGMDYKPAPGCACLFDDLSVRLVTEIVPFEPSSNGAGGGGGRKAKAAKKKKGRHAVLTAATDDDDDAREDTAEHAVPPCPVGYMDPKEFHDAVVCKDNDTIVLDVRNWYESRVGELISISYFRLFTYGQLE
jgi:predicted sulfurtransferase